MIDKNRIPVSKKEKLVGILAPYSVDYVNLPNTGGVPNGVKDITHPSVCYFKDGWNGYTHWMAATPYPQKDPLTGEYYENPCIFFANGDAANKHPLAFTALSNNPIFPKPSTGYNSDPEMWFFDNKLWVITRMRSINVSGYVSALYLQSSSDGVNWSEAQLIYGSQKNTGDVSPMYQYENGKHRIYLTQYYRNPDILTDKDRSSHITVIESDSLDVPDFQEVGYCAIEGLANIWHCGMFLYNSKKYILACGRHDGNKDGTYGLYLAEQIEDTNDFRFYDKPIVPPFGGYRPFGFLDANNTLVIYTSVHNGTMTNIWGLSATHLQGNFVGKIEINMDYLLTELAKYRLESI